MRVAFSLMRGRGLIVLVVAGVAAAAVAAGAIAADVSKGQKVTVAHGKFAHRTWSLSAQGRHHHSCYELTLSGDGVASGSAVCSPDKRRPPLFRPFLNLSDDKATVDVEVTRNRVRTMRLKIGHPRSNRPSEWIHVRNKRMTRPEAHKADVRRNFRFAVLHSRGNLCVKEFVLFNRDGDRIKKQRVPCEF